MQVAHYVTSNVTLRRASRRAACAARARELRSKSAGFHAVRRGVFPPRPELAPATARRLTPTAIAILAIVRGVRKPGVQVSVAELMLKLDRGRSTVFAALAELGEHRTKCADGVCDRPGRDARGKVKCRGCGDPCRADCDQHAGLVRRVHQWGEVTVELARAGYKRRQCASVLTCPPRGPRRSGPPSKLCSSPSHSRPRSVSGVLGGPEGRKSVSAVADDRSERASRAAGDPGGWRGGESGFAADTPARPRGGGYRPFLEFLRTELPGLAALALAPPPRGGGGRR